MAADALTFRIGADTAEFNRKMDAATQKVSSMKSGMLAGAAAAAAKSGALAAAAAAAVGFAAAMRVATAAVEKFGNIQDISERTGLSPEFLQKLSKSADATGTSIDTVAKAVNKFAKELHNSSETGTFAESVREIGLSLEELRAMTPEESFNAIARSLRDVDGDSRRAALAQNILGKSGADLIGVITGLGESMSSTRVLSADQVEALDEIGDAWSALKDEMTVTIGALVVEAAPHILWMIKKFREWAVAVQSVAVFLKGIREGKGVIASWQESAAFREREYAAINADSSPPSVTPRDADDVEDSGGGARGGGGTAAAAPTSADLGKTPEETALQDYDANPANRNADGTFRNPGNRRNMQRQADVARRRADQRNNRLGGDTREARGNGAAQIEAYKDGFYSDEITPDSDDPFAASNAATREAQDRGFFKNDDNLRAKREKQAQDAMDAAEGLSGQDAQNRGGGAGGGSGANSPEGVLKQLSDTVGRMERILEKIEPKLPQRVLV